MIDIIIGNVCSVGAMLSDSYSGTRKTKREMLLVQCVSQLFYIASSLVLKGYSATVQNVVAIARNLFAAKGIENKAAEYLLILLPVILGVVFNNRGAMGLLPVIANLEYSVAMFVFDENAVGLKYAFIVNALMFLIFNFYILNFVAGIACIVITITTFTSIIRTSKENKEKAKEPKT